MHTAPPKHLTYDVPELQLIIHTWATTRQAPLWICIAMYVLAHADASGRLTLRRGQLRNEVDPFTTSRAVHKAVDRAIAAGWLIEGSTTTELRVMR